MRLDFRIENSDVKRAYVVTSSACRYILQKSLHRVRWQPARRWWRDESHVCLPEKEYYTGQMLATSNFSKSHCSPIFESLSQQCHDDGHDKSNTDLGFISTSLI